MHAPLEYVLICPTTGEPLSIGVDEEQLRRRYGCFSIARTAVHAIPEKSKKLAPSED